MEIKKSFENNQPDKEKIMEYVCDSLCRYPRECRDEYDLEDKCSLFHWQRKVSTFLAWRGCSSPPPPQKDYAVITQSIGRIARTFEGKTDPIAYDFVDNIAYLVKSYKKRCATYRKNGCYFVEEGD